MKTTTAKKTAKKVRSGKPAMRAKRGATTRGQRSLPGRSPKPAATDTSDTRTTNDQRRTSKKATIEALVRRTGGVAITELMAATGWQEHSVRAALTGLRKAGHVIARERNDGSATRYRITGVG
jgi:hypothetical protein